MGASQPGFCVAAATRRPVLRELSAAAAFFTEVDRVESLAFSVISPPAGLTGSLPFAEPFGVVATGSFAEPVELFEPVEPVELFESSELFVALEGVPSASAFALDVAREDGFFLLLAMKRCSLDATGGAGVPRGSAGTDLGLG